MSLPIRNRTVADLIDEYEDRLESIPAAIEALSEAWRQLQASASVAGKYGGSFTRHSPTVSEREVKHVLLKSAWKAIYDRCQIDRIASATDKKLFERIFENPPELTYDNAVAHFKDYLVRPRHHILRGLAETFSSLDDAYKSHSKVKIGVAGLPKRVIVSNVGSYSSYGLDKVRDIANALAAYRAEKLVEHGELVEIAELSSYKGHAAGEVVLDGSHYTDKDGNRAPNRGLTIRKFQNGNAHVIFDKWALLDINRALAEFYGDVLPDVEDDEADPQPSTTIAKDLQFYWSPDAVIAAALNCVGLYETGKHGQSSMKVLEPSCGDGRILDMVRARGHRGFGIEYHGGRAHEARMKGHNVLTANFLEQPARPEFDYVVMNPPFYGRHYAKHVRHALRFLRPGGELVAILPATAHYEHKELEGHWQDLPAGSFSEAGTNVPTGLLKVRAV